MKLTLSIIQDDSPENPREFESNLGCIIHWHRRLNIGDKYGVPGDVPKSAVKLPVYIYQHGSVALRCEPFDCPWDSGQVGIIFVTKEKLIEEFGSDTEESRRKAERVLRQEIETLNQFFSGDAWGYVIKKGDEHVDSCWGFYGHEYCKAEGERVLAIAQAREDKSSKLSTAWLSAGLDSNSVTQ